MRNLFLFLGFIFIHSLQAQRIDFKAINFRKADSIAKEYKGEALFNVPLLVQKLTDSLDTEVERFRAIYYWVSHNIKGDYSMRYKNDSRRIRLQGNQEELLLWNQKFKKEVFERLIHKKETLCTGYAFLIKEMSKLAGLESEIIHGYSTTDPLKRDALEAPNHSWNAIKLNKKWYLCDATWSSGFIDMASRTFYFKFEDRYFLMEPSLFGKEHKPKNRKWELQDTMAQLSLNRDSFQDNTISCSEKGCSGIYNGPEFINGSDIAHQFSNAMSKAVGDELKKLFHLKTYRMVDFSNIKMTTKGMGTGQVVYQLEIPFAIVTQACEAYTSFDHVGGWNHTPDLVGRKQELLAVLMKGHQLSISNLTTTPEGLQEYWIQWKNKKTQSHCE